MSRHRVFGDVSAWGIVGERRGMVCDSPGLFHFLRGGISFLTLAFFIPPLYIFHSLPGHFSFPLGVFHSLPLHFSFLSSTFFIPWPGNFSFPLRGFSLLLSIFFIPYPGVFHSLRGGISFLTLGYFHFPVN
jgi:hypothetical protein